MWSAFRGKIEVTCIIFPSTFSSAGTGAESPGRRLDPGLGFARQTGEGAEGVHRAVSGSLGTRSEGPRGGDGSLARAARGRRAAGGGGLAGGRGWPESETPEGRAGSGRRKGQGTGCGRGSEWPRRGEDADRRVKTRRGRGARRALGASPRRTRRPRSRGSGLQERRGHSGRTEGGAWGTRTAPSSKAAEFSRRRDRGRGERGDARAELRGATGRSPLARPGAGHVAVSSEGQPGGGGRGSPRLLKPPPSFPQSSWHVFCSAPCRVRGDKPGSCAGC